MAENRKTILPGDKISSIQAAVEVLERVGYVADQALATAVFLALRLEKPLFLEGPPGVGKTEAAVALAQGLELEFIRLQCYEGLDRAAALYEWNYPKQLLKIRLAEAAGQDPAGLEPVIFSEEYLLLRPLLRSLRSEAGAVLLIDELDRADEEFEAFLLEILADFRVTIPELGPMEARIRPKVIITSNRTREVHEALRRRCLYHWIDYPDPAKELRVVQARLPGVNERLAAQAVNFLQRLRRSDLVKLPGLSETLDWIRALTVLNASALDPDLVEQTLGCLLKYQDDLVRFRENIWADSRLQAAFLGGGASC